MNKDFSQKNYSSRRSAQRGRGWWVLLLVLIVALLAGAGYFVYQYKKQPERMPAMTSFFAALQHWFTDRKHQGVTPVKKLSENEETAPEPIHFEFYTTLTNTRAPVTASPVVAEKPAEKAPTKIEVAHENSSPPHSNHLSRERERSTRVSAAGEGAENLPSPLFNASELEQDFSKHLHQRHHFIVQVGAFNNLESATRYQHLLIEEGVRTKVEKTEMNGKSVYRVQSAGFASKEQAQQFQQQLQRKGINSLIKKIEQS